MIEPAAGILLISDPFLKDPNFMRTVVFLCEHQDQGSFGFVLNRKYENTIDQIIPELEGYKMPVYYGGPVQTDTLHFIHQYAEEIPGSVEVIKGVYWGGDFDILMQMIKKNEIDQNKVRFFIGYSGWGSGKLVFHKKHEEIWKDALKQLGGDYEIMINFPIDPQLN
jgi:putative transcriptional regulator